MSKMTVTADAKPMLNAYPDSVGGTLSDITGFLQKPELKDVFSSFYILPSVFNTDLDRGFSVIDYTLNEELADKKVEELETLYPESTMFGILPAYGMYVRHARNIQLYGLSFELLKEDGRPAIICDDVDNADIQQIMTYGEKGGKKIVIK